MIGGGPCRLQSHYTGLGEGDTGNTPTNRHCGWSLPRTPIREGTQTGNLAESPPPTVIPAKAGIHTLGLSVAPPRRSPTSANLLIHIEPRRIVLLDQLNLPCPVPPFHRPFPTDGAVHGLVNLIPYQHMNAVALRESLYEASSVLPHSTYEVRGYSQVQSAPRSACQDVDGGCFHLQRPWIRASAGWRLWWDMDSRFRGNDGWGRSYPSRPCSPAGRVMRCAAWYVCGCFGISNALPSSSSPTVRIWIFG